MPHPDDVMIYKRDTTLVQARARGPQSEAEEQFQAARIAAVQEGPVPFPGLDDVIAVFMREIDGIGFAPCESEAIIEACRGREGVLCQSLHGSEMLDGELVGMFARAILESMATCLPKHLRQCLRVIRLADGGSDDDG